MSLDTMEPTQRPNNAFHPEGDPPQQQIIVQQPNHEPTAIEWFREIQDFWIAGVVAPFGLYIGYKTWKAKQEVDARNRARDESDDPEEVGDETIMRFLKEEAKTIIMERKKK